MVMRKIHGTIRRTYNTIGGMRKVLDKRVNLTEIGNIARSLDGQLGKSKWSLGFEDNDRNNAPVRELLEDVVEDFVHHNDSCYTRAWHEVYKNRTYEKHYFDVEHGFRGERPYKCVTITYKKKRQLTQKPAKSLKSYLGVFYAW